MRALLATLLIALLLPVGPSAAQTSSWSKQVEPQKPEVKPPPNSLLLDSPVGSRNCVCVMPSSSALRRIAAMHAA